jgi:hypothetical protein
MIRLLLSFAVLSVAFSTTGNAMMPQACIQGLKRVTPKLQKAPPLKTYNANLIEQDIKTAYLRADKTLLIQALSERGISKGLLKSNPILLGSEDPKTEILDGFVDDSGIVTLRTVSFINLYSQYGTFIAQVRMRTDLGQKSNEAISNNTSFELDQGKTARFTPGYFYSNNLEQNVRTAFSRADKTALKKQLRKVGVKNRLLKFDPILAGADQPSVKVVNVLSNGGLVTLQTVSTINIYTYYGTFIARVKMKADLNQLANEQNSENVSFEFASLTRPVNND